MTVKGLTVKGKHPHGRGEDSSLDTLVCSKKETPPRAWGRLEKADDEAYRDGNTPTGVGKTGH
ncbi:hypothetical protein BMETH_296_4 [methanotrophic bacterial endosymbiont of Bathymodiolus sp.]|nr:hypothetical protein BMETH_296_4 [methanotrophic bacterial endosymbiont of Bathymodiolus sp.]